jgi:outer membrane lipoprotein-sorting protein
MTKRIVASLLTLLLLPAIAVVAAPQALTADQIVDMHLAAIGGREVLAKLTSQRVTGTITIGSPMGDLSGPVEMTAKAPNKMRADMRIDLTTVGGPGEMVMTQLFDGTTGWTINSLQGETPLTGGQLDTARNNFFPTPLLTYKDLGMTAAVQPNEQIAGKDTHVILLTPKSGPAQRMFFDATSFMLVRTTSTIDAAELGTVQQVSDMSDFRTVDNMKVAFSMTQLVGDQSIVLKFTKIEHNVAIDDSVFVKK